MSFKQVVLREFGGPEKLEVCEQASLPEPSLEDVVEIHRKIDSAKIAGKVVLLCH
jgi:hypothetical protein